MQTLRKALIQKKKRKTGKKKECERESGRNTDRDTERMGRQTDRQTDLEKEIGCVSEYQIGRHRYRHSKQLRLWCIYLTHEGWAEHVKLALSTRSTILTIGCILNRIDSTRCKETQFYVIFPL